MLALTSVLVCTQRASLGRGRELARALHDHVVRRTGQRGRGIRPASYRVLRPHDTPACLIELGFLTDRDEEDLMLTRAWQERVARGIREGLIAWLDTPPQGHPHEQRVVVAELLRELAESRQPAMAARAAVRTPRKVAAASLRR